MQQEGRKRLSVLGANLGTKATTKENLLFSVQNWAEHLLVPKMICELNDNLGLGGLLLFISQ